MLRVRQLKVKVVVEDRNNVPQNYLGKSFTDTNSLASQKRHPSQRMTRSSIRSLVPFASRVETLGFELRGFAPLSGVAMDVPEVYEEDSLLLNFHSVQHAVLAHARTGGKLKGRFDSKSLVNYFL